VESRPSGPDWILIDGSSMIFRAFYGVPKTVTSPDGRLINAVRGFCETLTRIITSRRPRGIAIASDVDWRPAWRVQLIPSYKAHRTAEPIPPELIPQMAFIERLARAVGIDWTGQTELEAEDIIASWTARLPGKIDIVSGDRDLFALVRDPDVRILYPEKGGLLEVSESVVAAKYGIPGRAYADFAILRGDPSDGLPGLKGVGEATAASMIREFGSIAGLIESGAVSDNQIEYLRRAEQVVRPHADESVPAPSAGRKTWPADPDRVAELGQEMGIENVIVRLISALQSCCPMEIP
jgi:5'-3' exonuclease